MPAGAFDRFVVQWVFKGDTRLLDAIDSQVTQTKTKLQRTSEELDTWSGRFLKWGAAASAVGGIIAKSGVDADQQLRRTQARLRANTMETAALRTQAKGLARELPLTFLDVLRAQEQYGALGRPFEEILRDLPAIARAQVAVGGNLADMAKHAEVFGRTFNISAADALDKMVAIENRSAATVVALGRALPRSAQLAAEAGLSPDEYLAILGGLAGSGQDVSQSARALTDFLARVAKGITDIGEGGPVAVEALEKLGISYNELRNIAGNAEPGWVLRFLERLRNTPDDRITQIAVATTLGGTTYGSALLALMENLPRVIDNVTAARQSQGEVEAQVNHILGGSYGASVRAAAGFDLLRHSLADAGITGAFQKAAEYAEKFFGWISGGPAWLRQLISWSVVGVSSLLGLSIVFKTLNFLLVGPLLRAQQKYTAALEARRVADTAVGTQATQVSAQVVAANNAEAASHTAVATAVRGRAAAYAVLAGSASTAALRGAPTWPFGAAPVAADTLLAQRLAAEDAAGVSAGLVTRDHFGRGIGRQGVVRSASGTLYAQLLRQEANAGIPLAQDTLFAQRMQQVDMFTQRQMRLNSVMGTGNALMVTNTAVTNANVLARIRVAAATRVWAVAQGILNTALFSMLIPLAKLVAATALIGGAVYGILTAVDKIFGLDTRGAIGRFTGFSSPSLPDPASSVPALTEPLAAVPPSVVAALPSGGGSRQVIIDGVSVTVEAQGPVDAEDVAERVVPIIREQIAVAEQETLDSVASPVAR